MKKQIAFLAAAMSMLMTVSATALAAAPENTPVMTGSQSDMSSFAVQPRWAYIHEIATYFNHGYGSVDVSGSIKPIDPTHNSKITLTLQKQSGSSWTNVKTWTHSGSGSLGARYETSYAVPNDSSAYRLKAVGQILSGSRVVESQTLYNYG